MAFTIEDVNSRTLLQQFHSLYKRQEETDENVSELSTDLEQEIQDRSNADADLADDIADLQRQLDSLGNIFTLKGSVATYADLPATDNNVGDVWYVISESTGYIWIDDNDTERWEQLGISVDLSNYVTQSDLSTALETKQNSLIAGTNISIIGDTISAQQPNTAKFEMLSGASAPTTSTVGAVGQRYLDTTKNDIYVCTEITDMGSDVYSYTWLLAGGNGKQNKLTAGTNISINDDIISASGGAKLYMHTFYWPTDKVAFSIITTDSTPIGHDNLRDYIYNKGYRSNSNVMYVIPQSLGLDTYNNPDKLDFLVGLYVQYSDSSVTAYIRRISITEDNGVYKFSDSYVSRSLAKQSYNYTEQVYEII